MQITYLDRTSADHARRYPRLRSRGLRLASFAVAGGLAAPRYSAAWEPGPREAQNAFWDKSRAQFLALHRRNVENGRFRVELLSVSGDRADAVFAGTFVVAEPLLEKYTVIDLRRGASNGDGSYDDDTIQHWVLKARRENLLPVSLSVYGTNDDRQFAIVLVTNTDSTRWLLGYDDRDSRLRQRHRAAREIGARPVHLARSDFGRTAAIYVEPKIGRWKRVFGQSLVDTETFVDDRDQENYLPVTIAQGGTGDDARFAAVFASSKRVKAPRWRAPVGRSHPTLSIVDEKVEEYLTSNGIPAAAVAVGYGGRLLHARAYRYAPDGVDQIRETTQFRIASLSKALTSIAAFRLVQARAAQPSGSCAATDPFATPRSRGSSACAFRGTHPRAARPCHAESASMAHRGVPESQIAFRTVRGQCLRRGVAEHDAPDRREDDRAGRLRVSPR